jgi:hypothetical protein
MTFTRTVHYIVCTIKLLSNVLFFFGELIKMLQYVLYIAKFIESATPFKNMCVHLLVFQDISHPYLCS